MDAVFLNFNTLQHYKGILNSDGFQIILKELADGDSHCQQELNPRERIPRSLLRG